MFIKSMFLIYANRNHTMSDFIMIAGNFNILCRQRANAHVNMKYIDQFPLITEVQPYLAQSVVIWVTSTGYGVGTIPTDH